MEKEILISVIIPAYNAEKHLDKAVQSVLCQMDGSIELILVNDGSTDGTGAMCDAYATENPNIHVIHKENGGTSSAKNRGISIAKGAYLSFMDSDDYMDTTAYGKIAQVLRTMEPDCLDFGWNYIDAEGKCHANHHGLEKNMLLSRQILDEIILPPLLNLRNDPENFIHDFACNKVFKGEIIRAHGVRFDEDKRTWEDRTFLLRHLKHCENYYSMEQCFYHYVWMPNSLSQRYRLDIFDIILVNFRHYRELFQDRYDFDTEYANSYRCRSIENMIFRSLEQTENREQIRENVLAVLKHKQVICWYSRRIAATAFEEKTSALICAHQPEKALALYIKEAASKRKRQYFGNVTRRIKNTIRKLLDTSSS